MYNPKRNTFLSLFPTMTTAFSSLTISDIFTPSTEQQMWKLLTTPQDSGYGSPLEEMFSHATEFLKSPAGSHVAALVMKTMMGSQLSALPGRAPSAFGH
jgi:hypothetical protein